MDLIPVTQDDEAAGAGEGRVVLSDRAKALAKLRTARVERRAQASTDLRLLGRIEANETTLRTVTAWTGGRIDRLYVNTTGEKVKSGQSIASIYSPEVYAAHQDLIVAGKQVARMANSPESSRAAAAAALEAARDRLRLLGVPESELRKMEKESRPRKSIRIRTPFSGTVMERLASQGAYLSTGAPLYRIAKLDTLWVQLDAYESDLSRLLVGQEVEVSVEAIPDEIFKGMVTFIDPTLDPKRRTVRVRVEVENPGGRLRPGMFAQAVLKAQSGGRQPLVVPATAPLFTGRRALVFVEVEKAEGNVYEPRVVRLGPRAGEVYPVVAGLSEGERIVVRGAFALDADLQIRGGQSMMSSPDDRQDGEWDQAIELAEAERGQLTPVVDAYLRVQRALAADDLDEAKSSAERMKGAVEGAKVERPREAEQLWGELSAELLTHAQRVSEAEDFEGARGGFEQVSAGVETLLRRFGNASWIQAAGEVDNSYFGAAMRTCGDLQEPVESGAYLSSPREAPPSATAGGHRH
jgi:Cu(I)/Ag(I) efflux system membrane fusion protein